MQRFFQESEYFSTVLHDYSSQYEILVMLLKYAPVGHHIIERQHQTSHSAASHRSLSE